MSQAHSILELAELGSKTLAFLGAAAFFGYRAWVGFFNLNCAVTLRCDRARKSDSEDYLALTVVIEKGETAAMTLDDVEARFRVGEQDRIQMLEVGRTLRSQASGQGATWVEDHTHPNLYISPKDRIEVACLTAVPSREACLVDVVVRGRKRRGQGFRAQWRSSVVSLPPPTAG
jgi:hypothetical protein